MEAPVVRIELSLEAAKILERIASEFGSGVVQRLTGIVPVHTRKALEAQSEHVAEAVRALELGIANPEVVDVPDPADS